MHGFGTSNLKPSSLARSREEKLSPSLLTSFGLCWLLCIIFAAFTILIHTISLLHIYEENMHNVDIEFASQFILVFVYQIKNGDIATMYCFVAIGIALAYINYLLYKVVEDIHENSDYNPNLFYQYMITSESMRSNETQENALMILAEYIERQKDSKDFHPK